MAVPNTEALAIQPNVYYTLEEAARLLRVSTGSMRRLLFERRMGVRIGRHWRILGAALLDLSNPEENSEASQVADWLTASKSSLREVWDNDEDAAYDRL
jgi:excisionase family DNA binding protein